MARKKILEKIPDDVGEMSIKIRTSEISINVRSLEKMTEAEISEKITRFLDRYGITPLQQQPIPSKDNVKKIGKCDLYIYDKRTIIEVKRVKRLEKGPHDKYSGDDGRSAFDQIEEYVKEERSHSTSRITDFVDQRPSEYYWVGIVTNYKKWWAWTWPQFESKDDGKLQENFDGTELTPSKEKQLMALLQREESKPVPQDLLPIFEPHLEHFLELYARLKDYRNTRTQKGLWFKQLEASGNAPESEIDEIFVRHTLLILITRMISKAVGGHEADVLTHGFVSWVGDDSREVRSLEADVKSYDWNMETRDIMRSLYMGFVPKKHRKSYGEYYTPDWLAEKLAMTVIDEKYIEEQLESFQSRGAVMPILDPACGSGSLLYHAGRFIFNSKAIKEAQQYMNPVKINEFVCEMLYGIDIHPVAVEMAKTNIHRLVRYAPDQRIHVYQGDSLLLDRPTNTVHSSVIADPDDLILYSPKGTTLVLPRSFLKSPEDIEAFARTARGRIHLPRSLLKSFDKRHAKKIKDAHETLIRIIEEEGNGVWEWYIKNQAAPLLLQERKAGRIISNPPWVRSSLINVKERKALIESEAKKRGLWVGGHTATSFDIAALFVDVCSSLYLTKPWKSGWVLMGGALKAKAWKGLRESQVYKAYKAMWDLGNIAFDMGFSTCVVFLGVNTTSKRLIKKRGTSIKPTEFLSDTEDRIKWKSMGKPYPKHPSGYFMNKKAVAKNGATLFPYNLVRIKEIISEKGGRVEFTTLVTKGKWDRFGSLRGIVPKGWVRDCVYSQDIYPYVPQTCTMCIIPMRGNKWDPKRDSNEYWKKASDIYAGNVGVGSNTPQTLQKQLDHNGKLSKQLEIKKWLVVYNSGGENMYAMKVAPGRYIIEHGCFYIPCRSEGEADYLTAVLNAEIMLPPMNAAKTSDLYFGLSIWKNVPIPRYDAKNRHHADLVKLSHKAGSLAASTYKKEINNKSGASNWSISCTMRKTLKESGLSGQIDACCKAIIDEYYHHVAGDRKPYW